MKNLTKMLAIVSAMVFFVNTTDAQEAHKSVQLTEESIVVTEVNSDGSLKLHHAWSEVNYSGFEGRTVCCDLTGLATKTDEDYFLRRTNGVMYLCTRENGRIVETYRDFKDFVIGPRPCRQSNDLGLAQ